MWARDVDPLDAVVRRLRTVEGIIDVWSVQERDKEAILELERNANKNASLTVGVEIVNLAVDLALQREFVLCGKHSSALRHPPGPILLLTADEEIVGEEIWEPSEIARLRSSSNIMFLGKGFVLFKDKADCTRGKRLRFEYRPQAFPEVEEIQGVCDVVSATMSPAADIYVKRMAKWEISDLDTGTVLIGFNSSRKR